MGLSGRREAVDLFFGYIDDNASRVLEGVVDSLLYDFARAIAKLYNDHRTDIDGYLDKMIITGDDTKIEAAKSLRQKIQNTY